MTTRSVLVAEADLAFSQLREIVVGVDERLAWAQVTLAPDQYLHSNGAIIGIVHHLAACKFMYASQSFRRLEVRWRDCFGRLEEIGTDWAPSLAYLDEAQQYWMNAWSDWPEADLERGVPNLQGSERPAWKIIATMTQHDAYHGGQIALLASLLTPTDAPPDMRLEEERGHVQQLPGW